LDTDKATESGVGSLAHRHRSDVMQGVTTSIFNPADDWVVDAALT
jgi:hypothetical protein